MGTCWVTFCIRANAWQTDGTGAGAGAGAGAAPAAASRAAAAAGSTASRPSAAPPTGRAACSWFTGGMAPAAGAAVASTLATAGPLIDASIDCRGSDGAG